MLPSWSRDGRLIYFGSRRSGEWQIWRMTATGEQVEQVTRNGGYDAFEAADGKTLYYAKREPGIWRVSLAGGEESLVIEQATWAHGRCSNKVSAFSISAPCQPTFEFFNFATSRVTPFGRVERAKAFVGSPGLSVSEDGNGSI